MGDLQLFETDLSDLILSQTNLIKALNISTKNLTTYIINEEFEIINNLKYT